MQWRMHGRLHWCCHQQVHLSLNLFPKGLLLVLELQAAVMAKLHWLSAALLHYWHLWLMGKN
jgi:hypothetical protein